ncbi:MAG: nucleotidyltransferase domain-containing protein [Ilumatobacteraceae bacterium]
MLPDDARSALERWLAVHDEVAPGLVEGLYAVGSLALDDWQPRSDIDIVAFTADPATDDDAELLRTAHELAQGELDRSVDGPRLAWGDVTVAPISLHRPWTLDGVFHHDGDCFEINPVRGTPSRSTASPCAAPHRRRSASSPTWTIDGCSSVTTSGRTGARSPPRSLRLRTTWSASRFDAEVTEWCVLGIARMFTTYRTGRVLSKTAAGSTW